MFRFAWMIVLSVSLVACVGHSESDGVSILNQSGQKRPDVNVSMQASAVDNLSDRTPEEQGENLLEQSDQSFLMLLARLLATR